MDVNIQEKFNNIKLNVVFFVVVIINKNPKNLLVILKINNNNNNIKNIIINNKDHINIEIINNMMNKISTQATTVTDADFIGMEIIETSFTTTPTTTTTTTTTTTPFTILKELISFECSLKNIKTILYNLRHRKAFRRKSMINYYSPPSLIINNFILKLFFNSPDNNGKPKTMLQFTEQNQQRSVEQGIQQDQLSILNNNNNNSSTVKPLIDCELIFNMFFTAVAAVLQVIFNAAANYNMILQLKRFLVSSSTSMTIIDISS